MANENVQKKSSFSKPGLVLGIIAISLSFIPILNNAAFFLGALALIFGIIAIISKAPKGKPIAAIILGVLSIVITLSLQSSWSKSLDELSKDLDNVTGDNTEDVLKNIDLSIGNLEITTDDYGFTDSKLVVKVTNKLKEKKSFSITIEAVDANGDKIDQDYVYANDLSAGQSQEFELFTYISSDKVEAMKNAQFKVVEASMY